MAALRRRPVRHAKRGGYLPLKGSTPHGAMAQTRKLRPLDTAPFRPFAPWVRHRCAIARDLWRTISPRHIMHHDTNYQLSVMCPKQLDGIPLRAGFCAHAAAHATDSFFHPSLRLMTPRLLIRPTSIGRLGGVFRAAIAFPHCARSARRSIRHDIFYPAVAIGAFLPGRRHRTYTIPRLTDVRARRIALCAPGLALYFRRVLCLAWSSLIVMPQDSAIVQ